MNPRMELETGAETRASLEGYYRLHSKIYDATRWTFLFGRNAILREVATVATPARILEVGCGTGRNLINLCHRFPEAAVTGVDLSETMLELAHRKTERLGSRVRLMHCAYGPALAAEGDFDLILFSYALTMFNPGFENALATARQHLAHGGHIAVVDFHDTGIAAFERWMGVNHVRMNGQLLPLLRAGFHPRVESLRAAYGGMWRYVVFVGQKTAGTHPPVRHGA